MPIQILKQLAVKLNRLRYAVHLRDEWALQKMLDKLSDNDHDKVVALANEMNK